MKMEQYNHFSVARLIESVFDVVVQYVHLIATDRYEPETVGVRLQCAYTNHTKGAAK